MKKLFIIAIFLLLSNCSSPTSPEKNFNVNSLGKLDLTNIDSFWQSDSIINQVPRTFNGCEGYLGGVELASQGKMLSIHVFTTKETAIRSTEEFLNTISLYTERDENHEMIKEKWWHPPLSYYTIFVNKYNVIITVHCSTEVDEYYTRNIALEIMNRIERNSNAL